MTVCNFISLIEAALFTDSSSTVVLSGKLLPVQKTNTNTKFVIARTVFKLVKNCGFYCKAATGNETYALRAPFLYIWITDCVLYHHKCRNN